MRSRVSAAFAAGGRPGPRLAVCCGTVKLCHRSLAYQRESRNPATPANSDGPAGPRAPIAALAIRLLTRGDIELGFNHVERRVAGVLFRGGPRRAVGSGLRR